MENAGPKGIAAMKYFVEIDGKNHEVDLCRENDSWKIQWDGKAVDIESLRQKSGEIRFLMGGYPVEGSVILQGDHAEVSMNQTVTAVRIGRSRASAQPASESIEYREEIIRAPMPGLVVSLAEEGESVKKGEAVAILEAMKMENELRTPVDGRIKSLGVKAGKKVEKGELLVVIEKVANCDG